ncbi:MarR family winged helix-turn-helix transcriptional regulator [Thalassomonas haliotis]|uniref:MarR family transcriptional regulator n=1 Tax=Thalassomonas haliotis TaxID=485448 RepID=A0ABY7V976_9GAMM|nr:MarR family transcriptional regulator [Thalassomonas haliotis]WDE10158.1 MarR family transcriptional regulator [Thalassomonas haliotis]
MNDDQLKLDNQLCHRLYMASNGLIRAYRPLLEALNLTYPQYVVMMALWEQDGISIQRLLAKTVIDGGAMSLILKKMKEKDLLSITQSEEDKRKKLLHLLPAGKALKITAAEVPTKIRCAFPNIAPDEVQILNRLLDKVCLDLNADEPEDNK